MMGASLRGQFDLTPGLTLEQFNIIDELQDNRQDDNNFPGPWCPFAPSKDGKSIVWNAGEKYRDIEKWIKILIKNYFSPWGISVSGRMVNIDSGYGEVHTILVVDNTVHYLDGDVKSVPKTNKVRAKEIWDVLESNLEDRGCFNGIDDDIMCELRSTMKKVIVKVLNAQG
jgi:hypothetical protein